ncbi:hypothetical protein [Ensifer sp. 1H6]|uniref:hypothetical protein n=1 Tax=Ensifer sp. 1H6 TaxID=1911585 RepID=UPI0009C6DC23|nr:hypothetical protein [Ensifer sp. 1H6]OMQ44926.1 hypothetical protein BKP54_11065 [Ensifer sp. 1H6]
MGQNPVNFWSLTLREIDIIIRGAAAHRRHRLNELITAAWYTARLSAYAPQKAKDFQKLDKILISETKQAKSQPDWRDVLAKVSGWVKRK